MKHCPRCGAELVRDEVDIGVGVLFGPAGCPDCHWVEERLCICADPENCVEKVPGYVCRRERGEVELRPDVVCKHGVAMDVHCCNCHSGYIFDRHHICEASE